MRTTRILILTGVLALFALATMAPHYGTWDLGITQMSWDTEIVALNLVETPGGNTLHGDAEITLTGVTEDGQELNVTGIMRFNIRCISRLCDGFTENPVMQGEIKFEGTLGENPIQGQGTLSGPVMLTRGADGSFTRFIGDGVPLRARVYSLLPKR